MALCDIAIIGAGPYGLSIAAHLKASGVNFRIFGKPMYTWQNQMPEGMQLKSEGFASSLSDPRSTFTLSHYCRQQGLPYADVGLPVPLETFASYGLEFQKKFVPNLENKLVTSVHRSSEGFQLCLEDDEIVSARKIVVAAGITHFGYVPPVLSTLSEEFVTHSSRYGALDQFKGREVTVVGAGASALDIAALLYRAGASVRLVARKPAIHFHNPPSKKRRTLRQRLRAPISAIGPGWDVFFYAYAPLAFHFLSEQTRLKAVREILGPAPGWFVKEQVVGKVPFILETDITQARVQDGRVSLELTDSAGTRSTLLTDHVIAATGYRVDLRRLSFLDSDLQAQIPCVEHTPILSSNFESRLPGLYFVGTSSANSFGPLMRFACGAQFTARRLGRHLAKSRSRGVVTSTSEATSSDA